ncbi:hypothetical protein PIB30_039953 [Stylosanthes scabra]|uniref:PB1-like domain-containing protein n=1 Tax=Stylosanthes scabra TaxID=79078 RepID=A0ABU6TEP7_9FABA|nr:hypothetical protein [Stylosanthes scabra]
MATVCVVLVFNYGGKLVRNGNGELVYADRYVQKFEDMDVDHVNIEEFVKMYKSLGFRRRMHLYWRDFNVVNLEDNLHWLVGWLVMLGFVSSMTMQGRELLVRFDPDRPYEIPIKALMADQVLSSSKDEKSSTIKSRSSRLQCRNTLQEECRLLSVKPRSWELISPFEGWMCGRDDEKEIGGMEPSVKKEASSEEDPEEGDHEEEEEESEDEEDSEKGIPASPSLPMDINADEDYLCYIEELGRRPEPSPPCSSQASVPDTPTEASDPQSDGHNASSYDLFGVWQPPSSGPSS